MHCVVVISGMYATCREWMQYELDRVVQQGMPIIAVRPWGSQIIPLAVSAVATKIVGWNTNSIAEGIRRYTK